MNNLNDELLEKEITELIENRAEYIISDYINHVKNIIFDFLYNIIPLILLILVIVYVLITIVERFKVEWRYKLIEKLWKI